VPSDNCDICELRPGHWQVVASLLKSSAYVDPVDNRGTLMFMTIPNTYAHLRLRTVSRFAECVLGETPLMLAMLAQRSLGIRREDLKLSMRSCLILLCLINWIPNVCPGPLRQSSKHRMGSSRLPYRPIWFRTRPNTNPISRKGGVAVLTKSCPAVAPPARALTSHLIRPRLFQVCDRCSYTAQVKVRFQQHS